MDELRALMDNIEQTRSGIIKTEIQLANLHADIYKCREETRKARMSLPSDDFFISLRKKIPEMTDEEVAQTIRRLRRKRNQVEASLAKIRKKTHCEIQKTCPRTTTTSKPSMFSYVLFTSLLLGLSFFIGRSSTHRR